MMAMNADDDFDPQIVWSNFRCRERSEPNFAEPRLTTYPYADDGLVEDPSRDCYDIEQAFHRGRPGGNVPDDIDLDEPFPEDSEAEIVDDVPICRNPNDSAPPEPPRKLPEAHKHMYTESDRELLRLAVILNRKLGESVKTIDAILPRYKAEIERSEATLLGSGTEADPCWDALRSGGPFDIHRLYFSVDEDTTNVPQIGQQNETFGGLIVEKMRGWKTIHEKKLFDCVLAEALNEEVDRIETKVNALIDRGEGGSQEAEKLFEALDELANIDAVKALGPRDRQFDWMKISSVNFTPTVSEYSVERELFRPEALELMWRNVLHPSNNLTPWTMKEDLLLRKLVTELGMYSWEAISVKMGNRSAYSCACRFQACHNATIRASSFSTWEDRALMRLVDQWQSKSGLIDWERVGSYFYPTRSEKELKARFYQLVADQFIPKGPSFQDLSCYIAFVKLFGAGGGDSWSLLTRRKPPHVMMRVFARRVSQVARKHVGGVMCRWNKKDDEKLLLQLATHGDNFQAYVGKFHCGLTFLKERYELLTRIVVEGKRTLDHPELRNKESCVFQAAASRKAHEFERAVAVSSKALRIAEDERLARTTAEVLGSEDAPYASSVRLKLFFRACQLMGIRRRPKVGNFKPLRRGGVMQVRKKETSVPNKPFSKMPLVAVDRRYKPNSLSGRVIMATKILGFYSLIAERRYQFEPNRLLGQARFVTRKDADDFRRVVATTASWIRLEAIADPEKLNELQDRLKDRDGFFKITGEKLVEQSDEKLEQDLENALDGMVVESDEGFKFAPPMKTRVVGSIELLRDELFQLLAEQAFGSTLPRNANLEARWSPAELNYSVAPACVSTMTAYETIVMLAKAQRAASQMLTDLPTRYPRFHSVKELVEQSEEVLSRSAAIKRGKEASDLRARLSSSRIPKVPQQFLVCDGLLTNRAAEMGDIPDAPIFVKAPVATYSRKRNLPEDVGGAQQPAPPPPPSPPRPLIDRHLNGVTRRVGAPRSTDQRLGEGRVVGEAEKVPVEKPPANRVERKKRVLVKKQDGPGYPCLSPEDSQAWLKSVVGMLFTMPHLIAVSEEIPGFECEGRIKGTISKADVIDAAERYERYVKLNLPEETVEQARQHVEEERVLDVAVRHVDHEDSGGNSGRRNWLEDEDPFYAALNAIEMEPDWEALVAASPQSVGSMDLEGLLGVEDEAGAGAENKQFAELQNVQIDG